MRVKKSQRSRSSATRSGSPPRMRGKAIERLSHGVAVGLGIHRLAPEQRLPVQIFQVSELAAGEEVLFHVPDQTFYFPFGLRIPDPANLRQKAHLYRKVREENCVLQITLPASRPATTVFMLSVRTSFGTPPKYRNAFSIHRSILRKSQRLTNSMLGVS